MPAFSVAFTPEAYELVDRGGKNFHFRVTKARLEEVSLTDIPALRLRWSGPARPRCPMTSPILAIGRWPTTSRGSNWRSPHDDAPRPNSHTARCARASRR